ncbi:P-loop containing nucleoside triphosphate hydrolase protein, partial [Panaeolus papilionaceus]
LAKELEGLRKTIDVSVGEKQSLVAAHTFMRFHSNLIKFVAVDEPSSALDAEAELRPFQRLVNIREGKTMVFVTHRFGGLVKEADLVVCMKKGTIAEMGTHEELMKKDGEYAKI